MFVLSLERSGSGRGGHRAPGYEHDPKAKDLHFRIISPEELALFAQNENRASVSFVAERNSVMHCPDAAFDALRLSKTGS
jgi:hypothetical protein